MSILRQIFDGAYYPSEQILPTSQEYREKRAACNEAQKKLREALGTEKKELLDEFLNAYADVQDFMYFEFFREGIRFGVELATETEAEAEEGESL